MQNGRKRGGHPCKAGHLRVIRSQPLASRDTHIISQRPPRRKKVRWRATRRTYVVGACALAIMGGVTALLIHACAPSNTALAAEGSPIPISTPAETPAATNADMMMVDVRKLAQAWANEGGFELRYEISNKERDLISRVVMAEAGGEPFAGQVAVAQCILDTCEQDGIRPAAVIERYQYAPGRPDPSDSVVEAVSAVFDRGFTVCKEPILYFYNPAKATSPWHESKQFVIEINNHRFFAEREAEDE
jgi:hypothetical protein